MRLVRFLPERWQKLASELLSFGAVGVFNSIADFAVFNALLPIGPIKANLVSTFVATTVSYLLNRHWTYRDRERTTLRREYMLFFALNMVGFVIQSAVLGVAKYGLGFTEHSDRIAFNIAKAAGIGIAMVFRFWSYRTFVFKTAPAVATVDIPAEPVAPHQVTATEVEVGTPADEDEFTQLTAPLEAELSASDPVWLNDKA